MLEPINIKREVGGFYTFVKHKNDSDGNPIPGTAEIVGMADTPNLLTNYGMNSFAGSQFMSFSSNGTACCVGSGNQTPQFTDTQLQSQVAQTQNQPSGIGAASGIVLTDTANRYGFLRNVWRFGDGLAAGNLQEVGIRGYPVDGNSFNTAPLMSRALIRDVNGNPTSITVLSDETLDVFYEIRSYIPNDDVTGSIVLDGITYNYTARPVDVGAENYGAWWYQIASGRAIMSGARNDFSWQSAPYNQYITTTSNLTLYPQTQRAYELLANGQAPANVLKSAYAQNSYQLDLTLVFGLLEGNLAQGVGTILASTGMFGGYQIVFDKRIPKDGTKKWNQPIRISWARR